MKKNKQIRETEWAAVARHFYNESVESDETQTNRVLDDEIPMEISKTAEKVDRYYSLKKYDSAKAFEKVKPRLLDQKQKPIIFRLDYPLLKIAAIVVFVIMLTSVGFYLSRPWGTQSYSSIPTNEFELSTIVLEDGSVVTLNHDTKINYPKTFSQNIREVSIEGEAYFEVQPDKDKPFVIHAGETDIMVLGTSFSVNAYPSSNEVEVVVESGKVQVSKASKTQNNTDGVTLDPGDRGLYNNFSKELIKSRNDNPNFLAWKTRNIIFDKTTLKDVASLLSKVYNVKVKTEELQIDTLRLTSKFENNTLDFVLEVIALTHDLEVKTENEYYVLKKRL